MNARSRISEGALLLLIALFATWLAFDAAARSRALENLVLIVPGTILTVAVSAGLIAAMLMRPPAAGAAASPAGSGRQVAGLLALMVLLLLGLETVGFDLAGFLFLLGATRLLGERRPLPLLIFAAGLTAAVVMSLRFLLPFPMPTLIL
jgi:hypothetical protein